MQPGNRIKRINQCNSNSKANNNSYVFGYRNCEQLYRKRDSNNNCKSYTNSNCFIQYKYLQRKLHKPYSKRSNNVCMDPGDRIKCNNRGNSKCKPNNNYYVFGYGNK